MLLKLLLDLFCHLFQVEQLCFLILHVRVDLEDRDASAIRAVQAGRPIHACVWACSELLVRHRPNSVRLLRDPAIKLLLNIVFRKLRQLQIY